VSKKGMSEMAMNSYMLALEGFLLDDPVDRSLLTEQEANDLAMRTKADPMTLVYRNCLFGNEVFHAKNVGIRSKDHILSLVESEKKALCSIDTKRWILSNKITSFPYWHWHIQAYKNFISNRISLKLAEQRALSVKLSKKYQNESIIDLYAEIPSFHKDYTYLLNQLPQSLINDAWKRLITRKRIKLTNIEASYINSEIESFLKREIERYNRQKLQSSKGIYIHSMDIGVQTKNIDKAIQTENIDFLKQIKKANKLLNNL
ncbi:4367_t:CDS:2, partial [Scutellospora calospora]